MDVKSKDHMITQKVYNKGHFTGDSNDRTYSSRFLHSDTEICAKNLENKN